MPRLAKSDPTRSFRIDSRVGHMDPLHERICGTCARGRAFSQDELAHMDRRRAELMGHGMNDFQIAHKLSHELGRSVESVHLKLNRLKRSEKIAANPNERLPYSPEEVRMIETERPLLMEKGKTDTAISRELSMRIRRSVPSIHQKIRSLELDGKIGPNPNLHEMERYADVEIEVIALERTWMMADRKNDTAIGASIGPRLKRSAPSAIHKIQRLERKRKIPQNPNRRRPKARPSEIAEIGREREELIGQGKRDSEIFRIIAGRSSSEGKTVTAKSISNIVYREVRAGRFRKNPNNLVKRHISDTDVASIIAMRDALMKKSKSDDAISSQVAHAIGCKYDSVKERIRSLVRSGKIPQNPNRKRVFTMTDLETIASLRSILAIRGATDHEIARILAKKLQRTVDTMYHKICQQIRLGSLPPNPNKKPRK